MADRAAQQRVLAQVDPADLVGLAIALIRIPSFKTERVVDINALRAPFPTRQFPSRQAARRSHAGAAGTALHRRNEYLTLRPEQSNIFFKLMEGRYRRRAWIITTNLEYDDWFNFLGNKQMVAALLSRLRHQCTTIKIDGPSLREPQG